MSVFKIKEGYEPIHELFGKKKDNGNAEDKQNQDKERKKKVYNDSLKRKEDELKRLKASNPNHPHIRSLEVEIDGLRDALEKLDK